MKGNLTTLVQNINLNLDHIIEDYVVIGLVHSTPEPTYVMWL